MNYINKLYIMDKINRYLLGITKNISVYVQDIEKVANQL